MNSYQEIQCLGILWPASQMAGLYRPSQQVPRWPEPRTRAPISETMDKDTAGSDSCCEDALNEVRKHYVLPVDASVRDFLAEHRAISQILLAAAPQLKAYFGRSAVFNLRAPVDEAGSRTLYAIAMWPGKLRDVRDALTRFDNDWWMARARQAGGHLAFTYELV